MNNYNSIFDIIGPVMIGPSSSHTAGAARIGKAAREIFGAEPQSAEILLYDSFAKTYRGHGTDVALVGGLLGFEPDDKRLPQALTIAKERGLSLAFKPQIESANHPNTVTLKLRAGERCLSVTGVSIGGGSIRITAIDGFETALSGNSPTLLILHRDIKGVVAQVAGALYAADVNIGTMTVTRSAKGEQAMTIIEVDDYQAGRDIKKRLTQVTGVQNLACF